MVLKGFMCCFDTAHEVLDQWLWLDFQEGIEGVEDGEGILTLVLGDFHAGEGIMDNGSGFVVDLRDLVVQRRCGWLQGRGCRRLCDYCGGRWRYVCRTFHWSNRNPWRYDSSPGYGYAAIRRSGCHRWGVCGWGHGQILHGDLFGFIPKWCPMRRAILLPLQQAFVEKLEARTVGTALGTLPCGVHVFADFGGSVAPAAWEAFVEVFECFQGQPLLVALVTEFKDLRANGISDFYSMPL